MNETGLKVGCLVGFYYHHVMTSSVHMHAYCCPLYESGTKTSLQMVT